MCRADLFNTAEQVPFVSPTRLGYRLQRHGMALLAVFFLFALIRLSLIAALRMAYKMAPTAGRSKRTF